MSGGIANTSQQIQEAQASVLTPKEEPSLDTAFFYGTLMHPSVLIRVIRNDGSHLTISPGVLKNYTRHRVSWADFPAVISSTLSHETFGRSPNAEEDCVRGVIVRGLTPSDLARLDRFETAMYACKRVHAHPLVEFKSLAQTSPSDILSHATLSSEEEVMRETIPVLCYVWALPADQLKPDIWSYEEFVKDNLKDWM